MSHLALGKLKATTSTQAIWIRFRGVRKNFAHFKLVFVFLPFKYRFILFSPYDTTLQKIRWCVLNNASPSLGPCKVDPRDQSSPKFLYSVYVEHLNELFSESFSNTEVDHNVGGGIQNLKQNEVRVMNDVRINQTLVYYSISSAAKFCKCNYKLFRHQKVVNLDSERI